jgi:N-acetylneuraminate synthase/N,N'-diacetyllegionaminate synthase
MWPEIAGRAIGPHAPVFAIAEIGLNHGGDVEQALRMVDAAADAGASAIKLQTLYADQLVAESCPPPAHVRAASLREFFASFELDAAAHRAIVARARAHRLAVLSTPFALEAVPMLAALGIDAFKVASGDLTYDGLIETVARTGKPMVMSTGMATLDEAARALRVAGRAGADQVAVLHCVSAYPAPAGSENLRAIETLAGTLGVPVGLSDHSSGGIVSAVAAVALGACIYERHLMLDHGPAAIDAAVSSTPAEFRAIVTAMEQARVALGDGRKRCLPAEAPNVVPSRRGLYARRFMRAGERVTEADVIALRPATALAPMDVARLVGAVLGRDVPAGDAFEPADIAAERPAGVPCAGGREKVS